MKTNTLLAVALAVLTINSLAADLSRTESYSEAYKARPDGSAQYVGKCLVHQDYLNVKFEVEKILVPYFEPGGDLKQTAERLRDVDPQLLKMTLYYISGDSLADLDDLTFEKISSPGGAALDLIRLNIGVGGGNGIFLILNRTYGSGQNQYEKMASIMDGEVEFCDTKVWAN